MFVLEIFLFIICAYFLLSLIVALFRFLVDMIKYPVFCKVLRKNIKMFKRYSRKYKSMIKDFEKKQKGGIVNESFK
mgnify:CR=1 FL=1